MGIYTIRDGMRMSDLAKRWGITNGQMAEALRRTEMGRDSVGFDRNSGTLFLLSGKRYDTCALDEVISKMTGKHIGLLTRPEAKSDDDVQSYYCLDTFLVFSSPGASGMVGKDVEIPIGFNGGVGYVQAAAIQSFGAAGTYALMVAIEPNALVRANMDADGFPVYDVLTEGAGIYYVPVDYHGRFLANGGFDLAALPRGLNEIKGLTSEAKEILVRVDEGRVLITAAVVNQYGYSIPDPAYDYVENHTTVDGKQVAELYPGFRERHFLELEIRPHTVFRSIGSDRNDPASYRTLGSGFGTYFVELDEDGNYLNTEYDLGTLPHTIDEATKSGAE